MIVDTDLYSGIWTVGVEMVPITRFYNDKSDCILTKIMISDGIELVRYP